MTYMETIVNDIQLFRMLIMTCVIVLFNSFYVAIMMWCMPKLNSIKLALAYNWFILAIMVIALQVPMPTIAIVTSFAGIISLAVVWLREQSKIKIGYKGINVELDKHPDNKKEDKK
jgi:hypothetical protein